MKIPKQQGKTTTPLYDEMARIVIDMRDARLDKFIPIAEARKLFNEGKLNRLLMGEGAYRNSYCYPDKKAHD